MMRFNGKLLVIVLATCAVLAPAAALLIGTAQATIPVVSGPRLTVAAAPTTYSTTFAAAETPISEGGKWQGGHTDGTIFGDVYTAVGKAYADRFITMDLYDDSLAAIKASACNTGANQYAEGTVFLDPAYTPPDQHEIELLLRVTFNPAGPNYAPLYEISMPWNQTTASIIKQNGTMGGFTVLSTSGSGFGRALVDGDVVRAKIVGTAITVYLNGVSVLTATDSTITSGQPGMGFFVRPGSGADAQKYAWKAWSCGPAT
jgi:hypothetical protein